MAATSREAPAFVHPLDRLNPVIVGILRSRLHWLLSAGLMLVTVTGRGSGRTYAIPVGYHDIGDAIVVMVSDAANRQWWRDFRSPAAARLRVRGQSISVEGTAPPPDSAEFVRRAEQAFRDAIRP